MTQRNASRAGAAPQEKLKIAFVDQSEVLTERSRFIANHEIEEKKRELTGFWNTYKRLKFSFNEEKRRQQAIAESRQKIANEENFYYDTNASLDAHKEALKATIDRFTSKYERVHQRAGTREEAGERLKTEMHGLIADYIEGRVNDAQFTTQKEQIKTNNILGENKDAWYADNSLEIARLLKTRYDHERGTTSLDELLEANLNIYTAKTASHYKGEVYLSGVDKVTEWVTTKPILRHLSKPAVASALAAVSTSLTKGSEVVGKKYAVVKGLSLAAGSVPGFLVSAGVGGAIAGFRERARFNKKLMQYEGDEALGYTPASAEREQAQFEEVGAVEYMTLQNELLKGLNDAFKNFERTPNKENCDEVLRCLAESDARAEISGSREVDTSGGTHKTKKKHYIGYSHPAKASSEQGELDTKISVILERLKELHRGTGAAANATRESIPATGRGAVEDQLETLKDIAKVELLEITRDTRKRTNRMRLKKVAWAVAKATVIGAGIGAAVQEGKALIDPHSVGLAERALGVRAGGEKHATALEGLREFLSREAVESHTQAVGPGSVTLPMGGELIDKGHGTYDLLLPNQQPVRNLHFENGRLTPQSKKILSDLQIKVNEPEVPIAGKTRTRTTKLSDFINSHRGDFQAKYPGGGLDHYSGAEHYPLGVSYNEAAGQIHVEVGNLQEVAVNNTDLTRIDQNNLKLLFTVNGNMPSDLNNSIFEIPVKIEGGKIFADIGPKNPAYQLFAQSGSREFLGAKMELAIKVGTVPDGKIEWGRYDIFSTKTGSGLSGNIKETINVGETGTNTIIGNLNTKPETLTDLPPVITPPFSDKPFAAVTAARWRKTPETAPTPPHTAEAAPNQARTARLAEIRAGGFIDALRTRFESIDFSRRPEAEKDEELNKINSLLTRITLLAEMASPTKRHETELINKVSTVTALIEKYEAPAPAEPKTEQEIKDEETIQKARELVGEAGREHLLEQRAALANVISADDNLAITIKMLELAPSQINRMATGGEQALQIAETIIARYMEIEAILAKYATAETKEQEAARITAELTALNERWTASMVGISLAYEPRDTDNAAREASMQNNIVNFKHNTESAIASKTTLERLKFTAIEISETATALSLTERNGHKTLVIPVEQRIDSAAIETYLQQLENPAVNNNPEENRKKLQNELQNLWGKTAPPLNFGNLDTVQNVDEEFVVNAEVLKRNLATLKANTAFLGNITEVILVAGAREVGIDAPNEGKAELWVPVGIEISRKDIQAAIEPLRVGVKSSTENKLSDAEQERLNQIEQYTDVLGYITPQQQRLEALRAKHTESELDNINDNLALLLELSDSAKKQNISEEDINRVITAAQSVEQELDEKEKAPDKNLEEEAKRAIQLLDKTWNREVRAPLGIRLGFDETDPNIKQQTLEHVADIQSNINSIMASKNYLGDCKYVKSSSKIDQLEWQERAEGRILLVPITRKLEASEVIEFFSPSGEVKTSEILPPEKQAEIEARYKEAHSRIDLLDADEIISLTEAMAAIRTYGRSEKVLPPQQDLLKQSMATAERLISKIEAAKNKQTASKKPSKPTPESSTTDDKLTAERVHSTEYADTIYSRFSTIDFAATTKKITIEPKDLEEGKQLIANAAEWGNGSEDRTESLKPKQIKEMLADATKAETWLKKYEQQLSDEENERIKKKEVQKEKEIESQRKEEEANNEENEGPKGQVERLKTELNTQLKSNGIDIPLEVAAQTSVGDRELQAILKHEDTIKKNIATLSKYATEINAYFGLVHLNEGATRAVGAEENGTWKLSVPMRRDIASEQIEIALREAMEAKSKTELDSIKAQWGQGGFAAHKLQVTMPRSFNYETAKEVAENTDTIQKNLNILAIQLPRTGALTNIEVSLTANRVEVRQAAQNTIRIPANREVKPEEYTSLAREIAEGDPNSPEGRAKTLKEEVRQELSRTGKSVEFRHFLPDASTYPERLTDNEAKIKESVEIITSRTDLVSPYKRIVFLTGQSKLEPKAYVFDTDNDNGEKSLILATEQASTTAELEALLNENKSAS